MAKLQRPNSLDPLFLGNWCLARIDLADRALRVTKGNHLWDTRGCVIAHLTTHIFGFSAFSNVIKFCFGVGLKRQSSATRLFALLKLDSKVAESGGKKGAAILAFGQH